MLTKLILKNFKSLTDLTFDLHSTAKSIKRVVAIYGENGSGKSNLISSIEFLINSMQTLSYQNLLNEILDNKEIDNELLDELVSRKFPDLKRMLEHSKTIDSTDNMELEYHFLSDGKETIYKMVFDNEKIIEESLMFPLVKNLVEVYKITTEDIKFNANLFLDNSYKEGFIDKLEKYFGKHTAISILMRELEEKNFDYLKERINENFFAIIEELRSVSINQRSVNYVSMYQHRNKYIIGRLDKGRLPNNEKSMKKIFDTQKILNRFFTVLYADIKKVQYETQINKGKIEYKLNFYKKIGSKIIKIPYYYESAGTYKLLETLPMFLNVIVGKTVFIDEIDSGIHDLLMLEIINSLPDDLKGQLVFTTHNTLLLDELKPEQSYVIVTDCDGNKEINSIDSYGRVQKNISVTSKYLKGLYGGVPNFGYLNFKDILDEVGENSGQ